MTKNDAKKLKAGERVQFRNRDRWHDAKVLSVDYPRCRLQYRGCRPLTIDLTDRQDLQDLAWPQTEASPPTAQPPARPARKSQR